MSNYFASEVALTPQTRKLWAKKPQDVVYPMPEFDPKPRKAVVDTSKIGKPKRAKIIKLMRDDLESFQHHRIFSVIRGMQ